MNSDPSVLFQWVNGCHGSPPKCIYPVRRVRRIGSCFLAFFQVESWNFLCLFCSGSVQLFCYKLFCLIFSDIHRVCNDNASQKGTKHYDCLLAKWLDTGFRGIAYTRHFESGGSGSSLLVVSGLPRRSNRII